MRLPTLARRLAAPAMLAILIGSCGGSSKTTRITVTPPSSGEKMTDAYVIVAAQKEYFPEFKDSLTLKHDSGQRAEISILYKYKGEKQTWTSPEFDPGTIEKIEVTIDGATLPAESAFRYSPTARK